MDNENKMNDISEDNIDILHINEILEFDDDMLISIPVCDPAQGGGYARK